MTEKLGKEMRARWGGGGGSLCGASGWGSLSFQIGSCESQEGASGCLLTQLHK